MCLAFAVLHTRVEKALLCTSFWCKSCKNGHIGISMCRAPPKPLCYLTWTGLSVVADAVNYVMRDFGVLRHREHVVAGAGDGVPDQKHAVPLPLQQRHSLLPAQPTPVPAATVLRVKISGHDNHSKAEASPGLPFSPSRYPQAKPSTHTKTLAPRARLVNRRHPQLAVWTSIRRYRTTTGK